MTIRWRDRVRADVASVAGCLSDEPRLSIEVIHELIDAIAGCIAAGDDLVVASRNSKRGAGGDVSRRAPRFSFNEQGEPLPGSYEATPMEMAAAFAAISRTHVHRRSYEMAAPPCHIDRNLFARIVVAALAVEKASYKHRARYQHRGMLGDLSIALLVALMNFGRKYGRIFPDYDTLAAMLRKTPETILEAMKRLIAQGFVTKHRRSKLVGTPQGQRRVQDSNCYEVHLPNAGLAVAPIVADKVAASGSDNPGVSDLQNPDRHENLVQERKEDRFWLAEPWRMADGSVY